MYTARHRLPGLQEEGVGLGQAPGMDPSMLLKYNMTTGPFMLIPGVEETMQKFLSPEGPIGALGPGFGGAASGAMMGTMIFPGIGIILGAIAGGVMSGIMAGGMAREAKKLREKPFPTYTVVRETGPVAFTGGQTSDIVQKYSDITTGGGLLQEEVKFKYAMAAEKLDQLETTIKSQEKLIENEMARIAGMKRGYWDTESAIDRMNTYYIPQLQEYTKRHSEVASQVMQGPQAIQAVGAKTGLKEGFQTIYSPKLSQGSVTIATPRLGANQPVVTQTQPVGQVRAVYGGLAGLEQPDWSPELQQTIVAGLVLGAILFVYMGDN